MSSLRVFVVVLVQLVSLLQEVTFVYDMLPHNVLPASGGGEAKTILLSDRQSSNKNLCFYCFQANNNTSEYN